VLKTIYGDVSKGTYIGSVLVLFWWIFTGLYHNSVIRSYSSTHLQIALLQVDTIFFGGAFLIISILFNRNAENRIFNVYRVRDLSIGISILIIANLSTYFTSGPLYVIAIYYQVWSIPAYMLEFYHLFPKYRSSV
jgi:hypothetical protein